MIMFWNRHEVYVGTSMVKFNEILNALTENEIKYHFRIERRRRLGGEQMQHIYIHKKDITRFQGVRPI